MIKRSNSTIYKLCSVLSSLLLCGALQASSAQVMKIANNQQITLATDHWQPFYGPDLKDGGYMIEVCKAAFETVGYQLTVKLMPWKRAVKAAKLGIYDGLLGAYYTPARAEIYYYSQPFEQEKTVLLALASSNLIFNNIRDLKSYDIGVMRGAVNATQLDNANNLSFSYSNDASHNFKKLLLARIDYMVTGKAHLTYIINTEYSGKVPELTIFKPALKVNDIYITLSKELDNAEAIMRDFNRGIHIIKENGLFQKIKTKHFKHQLIQSKQ